MMEERKPRVMLRPQTNPRAQMRLYCLPYAGGGAMAFRSWSALLPPTVEVVGVELPGRGALLRLFPFTRMADLVEEVVGALRPHCDLPFAFFGHSMGAIAGFEIARRLQSEATAGPEILFVSAARAPSTAWRVERLSDLPDDALIAELERLNGTPPAVLRDRDLVHFLLPRIRADFEMLETYSYRSGPPLTCAIAAFGGLQDDLVRPETLSQWREHTLGAVTVELMPGDHFFVHSNTEALLRAVGARLTKNGNGA